MQQHTCTIKNDLNLKKMTLKCFRDESERTVVLLSCMYDAAISGTLTVFYNAAESVDPSTGVVQYVAQTIYHQKTSAGFQSFDFRFRNDRSVGPINFQKGLGQSFKMTETLQALHPC